MIGRQIAFILEFVLLLCTIVLYIFWGQHDVFNIHYLRSFLILDLIALCIFALAREEYTELRKQYLKHSNFFLLGFIIVHFQFYIDYASGNFSDSEIRRYFVYFDIIHKAVFFASFAFIVYLIGYLSFSLSKQKKSGSISPAKYNYSSKIPNIIGIVFFGIYIVSTDIRYFLGGYGAVNRTFLSTLSEQLIIASLFSTIIIRGLAVSDVRLSFLEYCKGYKFIFWALLISYFILTLNSGDRGPILYTSIAFLSCFVIITKRKIRAWGILGLFVLGSFLITFAAIVRGLRQEGTFWSKIEYALEHGETYKLSSQSFSPNTFELAISVRAYHSIIKSFESHESDHTYGTVALYQILGTVPGLGSLFTALTGLTEDDLSSPQIATRLLLADHGMGTSCVADSYMDFGVFSLLVLFFFFGRLCRKMEIVAFLNYQNHHIFIFIISIVLIAFAIYIGRSTLFVFLRMSFLCYILILFGRYRINNTLSTRER